MTGRFKKGSYGVVHNNVWKMFPKQLLTTDERIVFLFLDTGPLVGWEGLYYISVHDIAHYTGLSAEAVTLAIASLSRRGLIVYDEIRSLMFVSGMIPRRLGTTPNDKQAMGISFFAGRMPEDSPATRAFVEAYREIPGMEELFDDMYTSIDTPIDTPIDTKQEVRSKNQESENQEEKSKSSAPRNDRETLRASSISSNSNTNTKVKVRSEDRSLNSSPKIQTSARKTKGNGNSAGRGSIPLPSGALEILLTVRDRELHQRLEGASREVLKGEYEVDAFEELLISAEFLPADDAKKLCGILRRAIVQESLAGNSRDGQSGDTYFLDSVDPSLRAFAEKVVEETAAGRMSRPKAREELLRGGFSETAAELLVPRETSR